MSRVLASALLGAVLCLSAAGSSARPAASLDPEHPKVGQRAILTLEEAPADSTAWPVGLNAAVRPTGDPLRFDLMPLRVGEVGVVFPETGDTLLWSVPTTIAEPRPELLRPLRSVGDLGPRWGATLGVLFLVLLIVAVLIVFWLRRRSGGEPPAVPVDPPHVVALRELSQLEEEHLLGAGRFEEFYVRGSHILRRYMGGRFALPVLDWTTRETVDHLLRRGQDSRTVDAMAPLLRAADEVKFARHAPRIEDGAGWLTRARDWIGETTPAPVEESGPAGEGT